MSEGDLHTVYEKLEQALAAYLEAKQQEEKAVEHSRISLQRVSDAQVNFDELVTELRKNSPPGSEWFHRVGQREEYQERSPAIEQALRLYSER